MVQCLLLCGYYISQLIFSGSELDGKSSMNHIYVPSMSSTSISVIIILCMIKSKIVIPSRIHELEYAMCYHSCLFLYSLGESSQGFVRSGLAAGSYVLSIRPVDPVCTRRRIGRQFQFEIV